MRHATLSLAIFALLALAGCGGSNALTRGSSVKGDDVEVLQLSPQRDSTRSPDDFYMLARRTALDTARYVGRVHVSVAHGEATLDQLFGALWARGNALGANAFKVRRARCTADEDRCRATLSLYDAREADLQQNERYFPRNMVYVFGDLDPDNDPRGFELNDRDTTVAPLDFIAHQNAVGETASISIGGLLGTALTLEGREGRAPSYWSLSGFGVGPGGGVGAGVGAGRGGVGVSFNTGRVNPVRQNLGRFLVAVLGEPATGLGRPLME